MPLTRSLEEYLKAIYRIQLKSGRARVKEVAEALNVKLPSASEAVKRLVKEGLVRHESYGYVELTELGLREAKRLEERYRNIQCFLRDVLGLEPSLADRESCLLEHCLSSETVKRLSMLSRHGVRRINT
ncbi:MAG: metal-dependent transcriptional regulator [Thermoprotei archaeon]|nr:MAG: metal-dependent transcriptional regulator [Thermoprotei archaeon]